VVKEFGEQPLDIVIHSLAGRTGGGEEPLLRTSRQRVLTAVSVSAWWRHGAEAGAADEKGWGFSSFEAYLAGTAVVPGYGGAGMSSTSKGGS